MHHRSRLLIPLAAGLVFMTGDWGAGTSRASTPPSHPSTPPSHPGMPRHHVIPPSEITLTHTLSGPGIEIQMPPVGLSLEYPLMAQDLGSGACPPPALGAELRRLGSPPLALAGASQDVTAPSGALSGLPVSWQIASLYSLPTSFWSQLHCLLSETKDPLIAGINMKTAEPTWASQMVAGAQSAATNGLAFSLGNEPDLYSLPNYAELAKPQANGEVIAVDRYLQLAASLLPTLNGAPVIGPELAIAARWQHQLPRIISELHDAMVGVHLYPLSACAGPKVTTVKALLSAAAADAPHSLAWVVQDASADHLPAILSESNSASCGGEAGVSDSPAAAVWSVRFILTALKTGFQEVRFHFSGGPYDPFILRGQEVVDRPLQSALVAINQWLPAGTLLRTLTGVRGFVATAIGGTSGQPQLILDNESEKTQTVILRGAPSVRIEVLSAAATGLQSDQLSSPREHIKLPVQSDTVLAVFAGT